MRRRTWIAAGCALALGVAGCGGGGNRLSKADLVKRGDQLCLAQRAADQKIGATQTVKTLAAKGDQLLASDRAALDRFAKLRPPSDLQADFDSYVTLLRQSLDAEAQLVSAARTSNVAALRKQILVLQAARPRLAAAARKIGFQSCSQGAG